MNGKWRTTNERKVYESDWVSVSLLDVELPDGNNTEQHVVMAGKGGVVAVVHDDDKGVLFIWRHRISGDDWGWEIPGGFIDKDEKPADAAAREVLEETGWRPGELSRLTTVQPLNGFVDHPCHLFFASEATWEGPGPNPNEAADIAWVPIEKVKEMLTKGEITDNITVSAFLWAITLGPLAGK